VSIRSLLLICTFVSFAINLLGPFYALYLEHFHVDIFMISLITAANPISKVFFGWLYSLFSKKYKFELEAFFLSLVLISITYLGFAFAQSILHIFVIQIVIGLSDAIRIPTENYLLTKNTDDSNCKYHFSLKSIGSDFAIVMSLLSGGLIVKNFGFEILFYIMSGITLVPAVAIGWKIFTSNQSMPSHSNNLLDPQ
jgi:predicted MFS family arabinose efflux permease